MPQSLALLLFTLGAPLAAVNFVVAGFGAALVNAAIGIGLSLAGILLRPQVPRVSPSDAQQQIRQSVPPRWKHYGERRIAGPIFWYEAKESIKKLYVGLLLNQGRIDSVSSYHIDDKIVLLDGSGQVEQTPYSTRDTRLLVHLGVNPETNYADLSTQFGYDSVRGDGIASILGIFQNFGSTADQLENYPNGVPQLRVTIKASVVWNPRDAAQIRTDESTWIWSENPVVCLLDYLLSSDGFALSWDRIEANIDAWKAAADICDETVWSIEDSIYENRYRVSATYLFTDNPADVVARFAAAFDGRVWQRRDGTIGISAGQFTRPVITLDEQSILLFDMERGEDRLTAIAGIRAQYLSHYDDFREQDADPWPDASVVLALTDDRVVNLDLTWAPSHGQARRLMEREYERANGKWRGQIVTSLAGLRSIDERFVHIKLTELNIDDDFEIDHYSLNFERMEVTLDIRSAGAVADPVRPAAGTSGLFYRGSGVVTDTGSSVSMNYNTVLDGEAPRVGDLVIFAIRSVGLPTWSTPTGWTLVNLTTIGDGGETNADLFKEIEQSDIDDPDTPLGFIVVDTIMHWIAFNPAAAGSPTDDFFASNVESVGNPEPVAADATGLVVPHIMVSAHGANTGVEFDARWSTARPDFVLRDHFGAISQTMFFKVYPDGAGDDVLADMPDAGDRNFQRIYAVKY